MRTLYWDKYKGIAAIAVIIIHACGETGNFPPSSTNWNIGLFLRQTVNFAVPLFFAFSGYFALPQTSPYTAPNWLDYYKYKSKRIVIPYIFWTLIYITLFNRSHILSPISLAKDVAFGVGIGIGYYVIVLIQYFALLPLINRLPTQRAHLFFIFFASLLGIIYSYYTRIELVGSPISQFPYNCLLFIVWYPFFHLGFYTRRYGYSSRNNTFSALSLLGAFIATILESKYLASIGLYSFGASQIKISSFMLSTLIIIAIFKKSSNWKSYRPIDQSLSYFGKHSYIIYLSHLLFLVPVLNTLKAYHSIYNNQVIYITLSAALTVIFCFLLIGAVKRFTPTKMHLYIGM